MVWLCYALSRAVCCIDSSDSNQSMQNSCSRKFKFKPKFNSVIIH